MQLFHGDCLDVLRTLPACSVDSVVARKAGATVPIMGLRPIEPGPTAQRVAHNVRRLREGRGWTLRQLSGYMTDVGRSILPSGLCKIELGERRIDVDDLVALASALDVDPSRLLLEQLHVVTKRAVEQITL